MINFFIPGIPIAQPRHRIGKHGAYIKREHPIHAWKESIILHCRKCIKETLIGGVIVRIYFCFERPKSHWNKHNLKPKAPEDHICKPDIDNLQKAVLDAMETAGIFNNDSQVISLNSTKRYDLTPGAVVWIEKA